MRTCVIALLICATFHCAAQPAGCFTRIGGQLSLDTGLDQKDAWLVGELHGVYGTSEIKLALIEYLHDHNGITDVFMEMGYSAAYLYNRYLQTGDTTLFTDPYLAYSYKKPNREFWKQLYAYNKSLKNKITIHGIDFERLEFVKVLRLLKPSDTSIPEEIAPTLRFIDTVTITNVNNERLNGLYEHTRFDVNMHWATYKQYYGNNFALVMQILFNKNTRFRFSRRNETMYQNLEWAIRKQRIKKFVVFVGLKHADKTNSSSLGYQLDRYLRDRLTTAVMIGKDCYDWQLPLKERHTDFKAPPLIQSDHILLNNIFNKYYNANCAYSLVSTEDIDDVRIRPHINYLILMKDQPEF